MKFNKDEYPPHHWSMRLNDGKGHTDGLPKKNEAFHRIRKRIENQRDTELNIHTADQHFIKFLKYGIRLASSQ